MHRLSAGRDKQKVWDIAVSVCLPEYSKTLRTGLQILSGKRKKFLFTGRGLQPRPARTPEVSFTSCKKY
ncbi:Uncharacterized protein dnm_080000 [Desulfonema magnum]|uniref:Uncharacterized protein n=1 Tax=Desulfonema magnum TaxID=45655 RepID=A0A975BV58_9BACT|nr:Uncharacterized protein dnm_080000 [Desulfonema magnum]